MLLVELRIFRIRSSKTSKKKTDRGAKDKINTRLRFPTELQNLTTTVLTELEAADL